MTPFKSENARQVLACYVAPGQTHPLLHNMSARPRSSIRHKGENRCRLVSFSSRYICGRSLPTPQTWCELLGVRVRRIDTAERHLRDAIKGIAALTLFPAIAPAIENGGGVRLSGVSDDPLIALAVLTRCSGRVFIRRKTPVLSNAYLQRNVALVLPQDWRLEP